MPGQKRLAGALAAVAAAMAISACGSSGNNNATIPPENADQLETALNAVQAAVDAGNCQEAEQRAGDFVDAVNALPDTVGTDDKETLRAAGTNLEKLAQDPQQCVPDTGASGESGTQPTTTEEETTPTVPTTTVPTTSTTTSTSTTEEPPPPETGGGNQGNGGGESTGGGGETGGGGGETGGGGGGGAVGGGTGGTGGTGTGGTGSGGGTG